jgi:imidazolonepropionase-like amidohydrolase
VLDSFGVWTPFLNIFHAFKKQICMRIFCVWLALLSALSSLAQPTFPFNGILPKDVTIVAFTHASIFTDYQTRLDDATLVVEKGRVVAVGVGVSIPQSAVVIDCKGKFIYPSFIDLHSDYGLTDAAAAKPSEGGPRMRNAGTTDSPKGAFGWNDAINSEYSAAQAFVCKEDAAKEYRNGGFGAVLTHKMDGIVRGSGALVSLGVQPNQALLKPNASAHYSFNKGSSTTGYPSSLMGSIALLRQSYYDAKWYAAGGFNEERNLSLEAMNNLAKLPPFFDAGDKWNLFRADKVGDEFDVQYILKTSGNEYQRLADVAATKATLIVPIVFPDAYDVSDPYVSRMVSLEELKHWELAPSNCAMLAAQKIPFVITGHGHSEGDKFLKNLRKAVKRGLSEADALKALTYTPASILGVNAQLGALSKGSWANFFIASESVFSETAIIHENWVQGEQFVLQSAKTLDVTGSYELRLPKYTYELEVKEADGKTKGSIQFVKSTKNDDGSTKQDTLTYSVSISLVNELLTIGFEAKDEYYSGMIRLAGDVADDRTNWMGRGQDAAGSWLEWSAIRKANKGTEEKKENAEKRKEAQEVVGDIIYPFTAYGAKERVKAETVLIKNATLWTCEDAGKIENGQLLIHDGKILAVGKTVDASKYPNARIIDAQGRHVTPGIIDEHSHIALASVNEGEQACSAEVEEARVVWPEDIDIYRQLSGGVTCAQLLHGSANPIGGQSALVKMHWGGNADDMLVDNAPGFIKFALGENVKQSNWYNDGTRYPQTRMGVEQLYYDHFIRAREFGIASTLALQESGKTRNKQQNTAAPLVRSPRLDLEMKTLWEILQQQRFVTCHSYVQSEINMLMHVADSMNFTLNTFTHILEGYKVADKMKAHGAGASSFSDWWAYKYEVKDAIPHNGALLHEQGITVAFNSDDAEMARRLNQEAAKAVKYGGVKEEEALKFVTLNPAKLLRIDKRTGSLAAGKDADVVIWTDHPLSIYAKAEKTFVDGICYFDSERDLKLRESINSERARIIQKMLNAKGAGEPTRMPGFKDKKHFHCDTLDQTSQGISFK